MVISHTHTYIYIMIYIVFFVFGSVDLKMSGSAVCVCALENFLQELWGDSKLLDRLLNFDKDNIPGDVLCSKVFKKACVSI